MFNSLHTMFMDQYTEQWTALDETAERIRALGFNAPGSYAEFIKFTTIKEEPGLTEAPDWREMVHPLVDRKSVESGNGLSVRVDLGGRRIMTNKKTDSIVRTRNTQRP